MTKQEESVEDFDKKWYQHHHRGLGLKNINGAFYD